MCGWWQRLREAMRNSASKSQKYLHFWVKVGAQERRLTAGGHRKALTEKQVDALRLIVEEDPSNAPDARKRGS